MKIGIFGGTFDPIHDGHLRLAQAALHQLKLKRVYFVLSPRSPFKLDHGQTPVSLRLAMLKAALRGKKSFLIGRWELKRPGPSYTVRTLSDYKKRRPKDQVFLILGSDAANGFSRWKNPSGILRLATLVIGRRPRAKKISLAPRTREKAVILRGLFPDISSTQIRRRKLLQNNVPATVSKFIRRKKMYAFSSA